MCAYVIRKVSIVIVEKNKIGLTAYLEQEMLVLHQQQSTYNNDLDLKLYLLSGANNRKTLPKLLSVFAIKCFKRFLGHSLGWFCVWRSLSPITHWYPGNVIGHLRANLWELRDHLLLAIRKTNIIVSYIVWHYFLAKTPQYIWFIEQPQCTSISSLRGESCPAFPPSVCEECGNRRSVSIEVHELFPTRC